MPNGAWRAPEMPPREHGPSVVVPLKTRRNPAFDIPLAGSGDSRVGIDDPPRGLVNARRGIRETTHCGQAVSDASFTGPSETHPTATFRRRVTRRITFVDRKRRHGSEDLAQ